MTALSDFLRSCIADDEQTARAAMHPTVYPQGTFGETAAEESLRMAENEGCSGLVGEHFDRWLPPRVLADCSAKYRIVDALDSLEGQHFATAEQAQTVENIGLALAEVYKDRPGYRSDWSPKQWYAANNATGIAAKGATREGAEAAFVTAASEYRDMLAAEEAGLNPATKALLDDLRAGRIQPDVVAEIG